MRDEALIEALLTEVSDSTREIHRVQKVLRSQAESRKAAVGRLREAGLSYGELARRLGITRSAVQSILR